MPHPVDEAECGEKEVCHSKLQVMRFLAQIHGICKIEGATIWVRWHLPAFADVDPYAANGYTEHLTGDGGFALAFAGDGTALGVAMDGSNGIVIGYPTHIGVGHREILRRIVQGELDIVSDRFRKFR